MAYVCTGGGGKMDGNLKKNGNYVSALVSRFKPNSYQDLLSVLLVFLSLLIAALSLEQAHWVSASLSLVPTLILAVLASYALIVLRLKNKIAFPLALVMGLLIMVWKSSTIVPRVQGQSALNAWWHSISSTLPSQNSLFFGMFLIIITWLIGCVSVWFVLKKKNVWVTVALGAVVLLFNLSNLPNNYYYFLPFYIFVALLLVFQVNFAKQNAIFKTRRDGRRFHTLTYLVLAVFLVALLVVSAAWVSPQPPLSEIGVKFDTSSMHNVDPKKNWFNIFSNIQDKWTWVESKNQGQLLFTTGQNESETILYLVTSDKPVYLLTRRYDTYNSWGWTSNPTVVESVGAGTSITENLPVMPTNTLSYSVDNRAKSDVILTTGQFVSADIPVTLKTLLPDPNIAGQSGDVMTVTSPWMLRPYQRYNVVNKVPAFTSEQLSAVKGNSPGWITQQYLQLPDNFPQNVKNLSTDLVKNTATEYDKLLAIRKYLNTLEYDRKGSVPSGTEDAVAQFLYSTKKGNCVNFASAMVTMLRSVGVPARFCTGYLHGDYDKKTDKYIVRGKQAHAWAEVYFPGYGWIQVETTPDSSGNINSDPLLDDTTFNFTDNAPPDIPADLLPEDLGPYPAPVSVPANHNATPWILLAVVGGLFGLVVSTRKVFDVKVGRLVSVKNPSEAYARMCYLAAFSKAGPAAQETPLEYSRRLAKVINGYGDDIDNITRSYSTVRYSQRKEMTGENEKNKLKGSWKEVCHKLIRRRLQARKWFLVRLLWNPK
jgi:transglutaminase-like putative cysteine protease